MFNCVYYANLIFEELEKNRKEMEEIQEKTQTSKRSYTHCKNCGAPLRQEKENCEYCGTQQLYDIN